MKSSKSIQITYLVVLTMSIFYTSQSYCAQENNITTNQDSYIEQYPVLMLLQLLETSPLASQIPDEDENMSPIGKMMYLEKLIEQKAQADEQNLKRAQNQALTETNNQKLIEEKAQIDIQNRKIAEEKTRTEERNRKNARAKALSQARQIVKERVDAMKQATAIKLEVENYELEAIHTEIYISMLSRSDSLNSLRSPSSSSENKTNSDDVCNSRKYTSPKYSKFNEADFCYNTFDEDNHFHFSDLSNSSEEK